MKPPPTTYNKHNCKFTYLKFNPNADNDMYLIKSKLHNEVIYKYDKRNQSNLSNEKRAKNWSRRTVTTRH